MRNSNWPPLQKFSQSDSLFDRVPGQQFSGTPSNGLLGQKQKEVFQMTFNEQVTAQACLQSTFDAIQSLYRRNKFHQALQMTIRMQAQLQALAANHNSKE